jgi:hypothetical protein
MVQRNYKILYPILALYLLIGYYNQTYLLTEDFYRTTVGLQISQRQFDEYFVFVKKWQ